MGLKSASALETAHFHQNPAFAAAIKQVAGYDEVIATNVTQAIDVSTRLTKVTTGHASSVATLPAGLFPGQEKAISIAALGGVGQTFVLTPAVGVTWKQADGSTACASVTFNAADKYLVVKWDGAKWVNQSTSGTVA